MSTEAETAAYDVEAVLERLESHMGNQDVQVLLRDCRKAASIIRRIRGERDEALSRVDELEDEREDTVKAFESDVWNALRSLLDECHFDWRDALDGGVTAEEAREHISTTLTEMNEGETRQRRRAMDAEAENEKLRKQLAEAKRVIEPFAPYGELLKGQQIDPGRAIAELWGVKITVNDLRAARDFLSRQKEGESDAD